MKLLLCHNCGDVFSLRLERELNCLCGSVSGIYMDEVKAHVYGKKGTFSVLGFANSSFSAAIEGQAQKGDLPRTMWYGSEFVSPGRSFEAFIIPESAPSVNREYN